MLSGLSRYSDVAHLVLRLAVGAIFLYHGSQKWGLWSATPEGMDATMVNLMKFLSIVEPLGGLALVLGFLTRYAALGLAIIMVGAIYMKMAVFGQGFVTESGPGWAYDMMILAGCIALLIEGAGKYSLDRAMKKA
jgi:putative oxidoreductase